MADAQGAHDHAVYLWDVETGRQLQRHGGISGKILQLAMSPDGRRVLFACDEGFVVVWELPETQGK
jgi:WD40 repeat protein